MGGIPGMGLSTASMNGTPPGGPSPSLVGGTVAVSGSVGGSSGNGGVLALLLIMGGLAVLYISTRTIQGSR